MDFPSVSGILFGVLLFAFSSSLTKNPASEECLEYEVRNQKKRIDILEEKNYDHEQEIFDLKNIVRNIRIDLDHVSAEHIQNGDSKDDRPSQHGAPLPSDYGALKSKRPSRLLPLQLIKKEKSQNMANEKFPSNCRDLNSLGHTLNGIYFTQLEMSSNKLAAVFCDFKPLTGCLGDSCAISENLIGYLDIKSTPGVYFYVQRNTAIGDTNQPQVVRFNIERLNIGRAMNMATGVFTAPKPGIYQFAFSLLKDAYTMGFIQVHLRFNNKTIIGKAFSGNGFYSSLVSFQSVLRLKKGDSIHLFKKDGTLDYHEDFLHHFSGFLLEEDLPTDVQ